MNLIENLLGQCLGDDLTETPFWTEGVYRALEEDRITIDGACTPVEADVGPRALAGGRAETGTAPARDGTTWGRTAMEIRSHGA